MFNIFDFLITNGNVNNSKYDREHYLFNNTVENYTVYTDYEKYGAKLNIVSNNAVGGQSTRVKI